MDVALFDLDFSRWEIVLLSIVPAFINIFIFFYAFLILERTKIATYFSVFVLFVGLWQMTDGLMKMSIEKETALEWNKIANILLLFVIPVGIQFILLYAGWLDQKSRRLIAILLYLPTIIFFICVEAKLDKYDFIKSDIVNWIVNPQPTLITIGFFVWISIGALAMLLLLWVRYFKSKKDGLKSKQTLLLASGLTLPISLGILFEVLYPLCFNHDSIPVTIPLLTFFSITTLIAIKKYGMLEYSPKYQWEQIVESMNEGILIVDNCDRIRYANNSFCNLMGYEFKEISGKIPHDLFSSEEEQKTIKNTIDDRRNKKNYQYEIQLRTKKGDKIWLLVNHSPYLDRNGKVIGSITVQSNITHLKDAQKAMAENEARLKKAQKVAHVGSWELNFATGKALWSDEACKIYGLSTEEKEQSYESWISFIHPKDIDGVQNEIKKSQEGLHDFSFEHRIVRKDGSIRYLHSVSSFEFNDAGYPKGLFAICHDITERVEDEKALHESEENMRTFMNESLLSVYFVDPKTKKMLYFNPALSQLLGYSDHELRELTPYDFINHEKEDIDDMLSEVIQQKKASYRERQWKRKDGKLIHVLVNSFYHQRNGTEAIYVAAQNITQRKNAEKKLQVSNNDLKTFIYKASHDIRGPLASIIGLVNIGKIEIRDDLSLKYLNMIGTATQKLDCMLEDLVKSMQIEAVEVFKDEINFHELIDDVLKKFSHFPKYKNLTVSVDISLSVPFFSNRSILETILQNLIENSIKYQKEQCDAPYIKITVLSDSKVLKLIVADNGSGIEESLQGHVFDMFFRGDTTSNGSGLGLYLVRSGVNKLNGQIELESTLLSGTTFTISIPLKNDN
jgi:PAS domain S-box-containing protein